jgi:hypothetical protein
LQVERSLFYQPNRRRRRNASCIREFIDIISQNNDCIIHLNELGIDLEKTINSKMIEDTSYE